jgi:hypothetical protein
VRLAIGDFPASRLVQPVKFARLVVGLNLLVLNLVFKRMEPLAKLRQVLTGQFVDTRFQFFSFAHNSPAFQLENS